MSERVEYKALAQMNRAHMAAVWRKLQQGVETLTADEQILANLMEMHSNYSEIWRHIEDYGDRFFDPRREENPFLHVSLHVALEKQIHSGTPPCVLQTVQRLAARGDDPHELRHAIMGVLARHLWELTAQGRSLDGRRYAEELDKL